MVMKSLEPELISQRKLQNSRYKLQKIQDLTFMPPFIKYKQNPRKKVPTGLYNNGHNWLMFMLHLWKTESSTMRPVYGSWC